MVGTTRPPHQLLYDQIQETGIDRLQPRAPRAQRAPEYFAMMSSARYQAEPLPEQTGKWAVGFTFPLYGVAGLARIFFLADVPISG